MRATGSHLGNAASGIAQVRRQSGCSRGRTWHSNAYSRRSFEYLRADVPYDPFLTTGWRVNAKHRRSCDDDTPLDKHLDPGYVSESEG